MYPETNENDSTIKTLIDTWYENNILDYTKYLEDTPWCNNRSIYKTEPPITYYGAYGFMVFPSGYQNLSLPPLKGVFDHQFHLCQMS